MSTKDLLRSLPAVDQLLKEEVLLKMQERYPRGLILNECQKILQEYRLLIQKAETSSMENPGIDLSSPVVAGEVASRVQKSFAPSLRSVINATGTVIHTNLGRAPLASAAEKALLEVSTGYSNLELSLETGERDSRQAHVEELLCRLTGAEGAVVVNNNAAAVFLVLQTLAAGREVIISRGELVEIGGSFRMPEVMRSSGAEMVEVGTTNKCYITDYERAVTDRTALLLKVHTSNYRIVGFAEEVALKELVSLGRKISVPVVEDLGSGALVDLESCGLPPEPRVQDRLAEGASVVTFSGDKLLGGPQAGIILGTKDMVARFRSNQLARALRVDKFTMAALQATLLLYWDEKRALREVPVLRMLTTSEGELKERAQRLQRLLRERVTSGELRCSEGFSTVGGGALPLAELPTFVVTYLPQGISPAALARKLRRGAPPVISRVHRDRLLFDVRTLRQGEEEKLAEALKNALQQGAGGETGGSGEIRGEKP